MGKEKENVQEVKQPIHQSDILPKTIKNRHVDGVIIETGTAANRPDGSTPTKCWFSVDTFVLSIWTGSAWKTIQLV